MHTTTCPPRFNKPPFDEDCICLAETLSYESDFHVAVSIIEQLLGYAGVPLVIDSRQWAEIIKKAYKNSRRITTAEFVAKISQLNTNIDILGEYTGSWNKIACKCKKCGHLWSPVANSLVQGHGCPICAAKERGVLLRKTPVQFKEELQNVNKNSLLLAPYSSYAKRVPCSCRICQHEWLALPGNLLKGNGCPICEKVDK